MIAKSQKMGLDPNANAALLALLEKKRRGKETGITPLVQAVEDGPDIREPLAEIVQHEEATDTNEEERPSLVSVVVNSQATIEPRPDGPQEVAARIYPHDLQDNPPESVVERDCWGGCIHFRHYQDSWICHTLDGDHDLTIPETPCAKEVAGYAPPLHEAFLSRSQFVQ